MNRHREHQFSNTEMTEIEYSRKATLPLSLQPPDIKQWSYTMATQC
jgi:hypothetical protein